MPPLKELLPLVFEATPLFTRLSQIADQHPATALWCGYLRAFTERYAQNTTVNLREPAAPRAARIVAADAFDQLKPYLTDLLLTITK